MWKLKHGKIGKYISDMKVLLIGVYALQNFLQDNWDKDNRMVVFNIVLQEADLWDIFAAQEVYPDRSIEDKLVIHIRRISLSEPSHLTCTFSPSISFFFIQLT